jgi:transcriptional regulator PpsR
VSQLLPHSVDLACNAPGRRRVSYIQHARTLLLATAFIRAHLVNKLPNDPGDLSAFSEVAPELADMLVSVTSDIALVLDDQGFIRSVALGGAEPVSATASEWLGRQLVDTVTRDTRRKVEELLREASVSGVSRTRHINHPSAAGADIPVAYTAVRLGQSGPLLVAGRDLRAVSVMQQRLVDAQQSMERDYWRMRHAETRYRLLFQIATDAVLVIDADTLQVIDANRAAARMFGGTVQDMPGRQAIDGIAPASVPVLEELLGTVRVSGRPGEAALQLTGLGGSVRAWVSPLRGEGQSLLLLRAVPDGVQPLPMPDGSMLPDLMRLTPDAIVFTDEQGQLLSANPAFAELVKMSDEKGIQGRSLGDWLERDGNGFTNLLGSVCRSGVKRLDARLWDEKGVATDIELSAVLIHNGDSNSIGFIIRAVQPRGPGAPHRGSVH